jgi:hypothetical protein
LWVYDFSLSGGGAGSLAALSDVSLTNPQTGQILTYDNGQWINKAPDKSYVRYAGAINFADLATNAATYLDDDYEDAFFLISDGGTIGTGEAAAYWTSNFSDGDVIPADAHIAVINVNRGTANPPSYKYDDFGGFVDISGKADKSELVTFVTAQLPSGQQTYNITNALFKTTSYIVSIMASQQLKYTSANIVSDGTFTITWSSVLSGTVDVAIGIYNP